MKLSAYQTKATKARLRKTEAARSLSGDALACPPVRMANELGWEVLCPYDVWAHYDGRLSVEVPPENANDDEVELGVFGDNVVTFTFRWVFRTDPGVQLLVTQPLNRSKPGAQPISAVVETDWNVAPFTMSYEIDGSVCWAKGEPVAVLIPLSTGFMESLEPRILSISGNLRREYEAWSLKRAQATELDRDYHNGRTAIGTVSGSHRKHLSLKEFSCPHI